MLIKKGGNQENPHVFLYCCEEENCELIPRVKVYVKCNTHLHGFDGIEIHPYGHPLHGNMLKHFIYTLDGSVIQSEVALGLNHVIVVWFEPSCYPGSANSTHHIHSFDGLGIHPYDHPLHGKVMNHSYIY